MDTGARNWLVGFARRNLWRLREPGYELQDLVQEGFLCYQKVLAKYPEAKDRAHIMALFKAAYQNHILDLARHSRHYAMHFPGTVVEEISPPPCDYAEFCQSIAELPGDVAASVKLMIDKDILRPPMRRRADGTRETLNERICRHLGLESRDHDLPMKIKAALKA